MIDDRLLALLKSTFGYDGFRGAQADVVARVMAGLPTCAIMPTGAGKSLCYQLPAVALDGTAVVISPLIALMHDQLRAANAAGIRAASLTSADSDREETVAKLRAGALDLLYVAPERASTPAFRNLLTQVKLALFAIDEAHCVSEWGHDFRPDYRLLRPLLDQFGDVPRLALTATADTHTRADILVQLGIPADGLILAGFDRPNIRYAIEPRQQFNRQIGAIMAEHRGPGIIYTRSRIQTEKLAAQLDSAARPVRAYHAGMPPEARAANQAAFVASEDMVMVATVAFGMGIDKPDVRFVAHDGLPKSIESYYQETGRAGRDGDPAVAHLFWEAADFAKARMRITELAEERQGGERARLEALAGLVETATCRRAVLLRHFGETPPEACGNCDNCLNPPRTLAAGQLAQKFLSAIYRTGQSFGLGHIEKVLTGQKDERLSERGHDQLSVFGIVPREEARLLRPLVRALTAADAVRQTDHGGLMLGPNARPILRGEQDVMLLEPPARKERRGERRGQELNPVGDPLFDALRAKRTELAREHGVPPYVIFHDSVLREMTAERPRNIHQLGRLNGIGARKLADYGEEFLAIILQHC